jgi:hypothetical protein
MSRIADLFGSTNGSAKLSGAWLIEQQDQNLFHMLMFAFRIFIIWVVGSPADSGHWLTPFSGIDSFYWAGGKDESLMRS